VSEKPEARILLRPMPGEKFEVSVIDPRTGREARTGKFCDRTQLDVEVCFLKMTLERGGNRVTVKVME
jgi:hypothetical protein